MTTNEVEEYLHAHIPLSAAMRLRVLEADAGGVAIEAALEPNLNHQSTAFGGSVSALAILTGWTYVHLRLRADGLDVHTVIHESRIRHDTPIDSDFRATAARVDDAAWARFTRTIARRGRGRVAVDVVVSAAGVAAAEFRGSYVAFTPG